MPRTRNLLRHRSEHEHGKVTFIELFFDLVFVFAVTQLSHSLIEHFTAAGAAQTLLLTLAVWWVWIFTSWVTNWLDPERLPVRLLLLAIMLGGLVMSATIPQAFEARGIAFAASYALIQVGRTLFVLWALGDEHRGLTRNFQRILVWLLASAAFWLAGGFTEGTTRLVFWIAALAIEYVAPSVGFRVPGIGRSTTGDWKVEGGHLSERCALFIIIALGESILVTGATFSAMAWSPTTLAALAATFVSSLAMWWLYFAYSAEAGSRTISGAADPGRLARLAYTYIHLLMVAGIIVSAAGDEFVLAHPAGHSEPKTIVAVTSGLALYLAGSMLFRWAIAGRLPLSPLFGMLALALLAATAHWLTPLVLSVFASLVIVAIAAWEARARASNRCP